MRKNVRESRRRNIERRITCKVKQYLKQEIGLEVDFSSSRLQEIILIAGNMQILIGYADVKRTKKTKAI